MSRRGRIPSTMPGRRWMPCSYGYCAAAARAEHYYTVPVSTANPRTGEGPVSNTYAFCSARCRSQYLADATSGRPRRAPVQDLYLD